MWYSITPTGTVAIGNLTPVGQNSGQVGCRWPPNGHQLAACLNLPSHCQMLGPFWYFQQEIYVVLPQVVYCLESNDEIPQEIFRLQWRDNSWQVRREHEEAVKAKTIKMLGGQFLIGGNTFKDFWQAEYYQQPQLQPLPWKTMTLSHNSRQDFQVKDEGGFFAEMTTLMNPGWSILVKVIGEWEALEWSFLGAGGTPVAIAPVHRILADWVEAECDNATGAVLLTGALWQEGTRPISVPYPSVSVKAYAADVGVPWQSWKRVRDRHNPSQRVQVLTPGEWMTPAGAVYLWQEGAPMQKSGPLPDKFNRHVLGYGHLWLFEN